MSTILPTPSDRASTVSAPTVRTERDLSRGDLWPGLRRPSTTSRADGPLVGSPVRGDLSQVVVVGRKLRVVVRSYRPPSRPPLRDHCTVTASWTTRVGISLNPQAIPASEILLSQSQETPRRRWSGGECDDEGGAAHDDDTRKRLERCGDKHSRGFGCRVMPGAGLDRDLSAVTRAMLASE